ncbi:MAG TPA: M66 family metalloprotease [Lysobacter sp.]
MRIRSHATALAIALCVTACPGGRGDKAAKEPPRPVPPTTPAPPPTTHLPPLEITRLELAQTHVIPDSGLQWALPNATGSLYAIGGREALAIMTLSADDARNVQLEGWANGVLLGSVAAGAGLPGTEAGGPAYATGRYSATVPRQWMVPGMHLRARAENYSLGRQRDPVMGADSPLTLRVLPFYLFGATETNSVPPAEIATVDKGTAQELFAKWPVATLVAQNHPARQAIWPNLVVRPRGPGKPAAVLRNSDQQRESYEVKAAVLDVLDGLLRANGEAPGPYLYYSPLVMFNSRGAVAVPASDAKEMPDRGAGSIGASIGVGDYDYTGTFFHVEGHAFGLPHQGEAHGQGRYPYPGGSVSGSAWGYDSIRREFLAPFVPATASRYARCNRDTFAGTRRQIDDAGRCIKQDPMEGGAGDEARGTRFAMFSDYSAAMIQRHLEGMPITDANGKPALEGGSIVTDASFAGGFRRWDGRMRRWVPFTPYTADGGLHGLDSGLPHRIGVPVHSIVITYSRAGTAGATQIYPPLSYSGNLVSDIDPTQPAQRSMIVPGTGPVPRYCHSGGCDFTVRVTYDNGSVRHTLLQRGFRPLQEPFGTPSPSTANAESPDSFRVWVVNVPGERGLQKIELLDTPRAWGGLPSNPAVLASRTVRFGLQAAAFAPAGAGACAGLATVVVPESASATACGVAQPSATAPRPSPRARLGRTPRKPWGRP